MTNERPADKRHEQCGEKCYFVDPCPNGHCDLLGTRASSAPVGPTLTQSLRALYLCTENAADAETLKEAIEALSARSAGVACKPVAWVNGEELKTLANPVIATYDTETRPSCYDTPLYLAPPSAREPGIRPAAFVGVMNALVRSCCYACGWPLGSCKPFDCGMRYSDGSEHLVEKKNWLKRAEDMAEVWKWIVAMQDAPVGPTANGAEMNNSGNIFPTLAANWEHFEKVDIAPTAPAIQRSEMQRAFYAGASTGLAQACFAQESGDFPGGIAELLAELKAWRGMRKASASPDSCGLKNTSKEE